MTPKVAIIYYSATGTTHELAKAVQAGANEAGAETKLLKVKELAPEEAIKSNQGWADHFEAIREEPEAQLSDLEWADAVIFGTPTRYGLPAAQLKQFIDTTGSLWATGKLANKIASSFATAATLHGGHETTINNLNTTFYHWGSIIVSPAYVDPIQFQMGNPYGVSFTSNNGQLKPDETALAAARFQGRRVTEVARQFLAGRGAA